jgi:hypothetical protein
VPVRRTLGAAGADRGLGGAAGGHGAGGASVAGKIYRVGILSTGKKPTLRELGQWLRMA